MKRITYFVSILLILVVISGCARFSQIQNAVSQFDQATHKAADAENAFLDMVITVDCEAQFYEQAYKYALKMEDNFKLKAYCTPRVLTPGQSEIRKLLMAAIVLYADKMQALATDDDNKQLDTNSQNLAQNLNRLATAGGINLPNPALVQGIETAFITIAKMALDQTKYKNIREAAEKMQPQLVTIVEALKKENWGFGQTTGEQTGKIGAIETQVRALIAKSHDQNNDPAETFFNIVNGRNILLSLNQVPKQSFGLSGPLTRDPAKPVNDALDAIINCNKAIAETGSGGINAAANDLFQRAVTAIDIYKSLSGNK